MTQNIIKYNLCEASVGRWWWWVQWERVIFIVHGRGQQCHLQLSHWTIVTRLHRDCFIFIVVARLVLRYHDIIPLLCKYYCKLRLQSGGRWLEEESSSYLVSVWQSSVDYPQLRLFPTLPLLLHWQCVDKCPRPPESSSLLTSAEDVRMSVVFLPPTQNSGAWASAHCQPLWHICLTCSRSRRRDVMPSWHTVPVLKKKKGCVFSS